MEKLSSPIDLIKKSISIFFEKKNLIYFLKVYAFLLPFTIITIIQNNALNLKAQDFSDPTQFLNKYAWVFGPMMLIGLLGLVISFWVRAAGVFALDRVTGGTTPSIKETFGTVWKFLLRFSILDIVLALIIGVGFILLIVPGFIFWTWFYFSGYELITKGTGIRQSIGNSRRLVSGRFWPVAGRFFVFFLFNTLVSIVFGLMPYGTGSILTVLAGGLLSLPSFLLYKELSALRRV